MATQWEGKGVPHSVNLAWSEIRKTQKRRSLILFKLDQAALTYTHITIKGLRSKKNIARLLSQAIHMEKCLLYYLYNIFFNLTYKVLAGIYHSFIITSSAAVIGLKALSSFSLSFSAFTLSLVSLFFLR